MFDSFRNIFRSKPSGPLPSVPEGTRYYAMGDIHGRCDLFDAMVDAIEADDERSSATNSTVILLGDLVDRGPDSAGVIRNTRKWQQLRDVRVLAGNHEEMFLKSFEDENVLRHFLKHGGRETIMSFGLSKAEFIKLDMTELFELLPSLVSQDERDYVASFEENIIAGDYLFVHAGIDPAVPISEQSRKDMLWIRDRFLDHKGSFEKVVVHGHTIFDDVVDCGNRIGVDTGAFRSGILSTLVLEGDQRRVIQTIDRDGEITVSSELQAA